jgi:hypothetical protein
MPLVNGTYHISMDVDGVEQALDLKESNVAPNTPVIGFTRDDNKNNQKVSIFSSV